MRVVANVRTAFVKICRDVAGVGITKCSSHVGISWQVVLRQAIYHMIEDAAPTDKKVSTCPPGRAVLDYHQALVRANASLNLVPAQTFLQLRAGEYLRDHLPVGHDEGVTVGVIAAILASFASGM